MQTGGYSFQSVFTFEEIVKGANSSSLYPVLQDNEILDHLVSGCRRGIALDIDETLSSTNVFWFTRMLKLFGNPENLTPEEMARKYHLAQHVPYWQGREDVETWMNAERTKNDSQKTIPLIPNAKDTVIKINNYAPILLYLTVRPQCVLEGTQEWLHNMGFPPAPIVGRPDTVPFEKGNAWKASLLPSLFPFISVLVDDNPSVMRSLDSSYAGRLLLFSQSSSLIPHTHQSCTIACPDWTDVEQIITSEEFSLYWK